MNVNWVVNRWLNLIHCSQQLSSSRPLPAIQDWTPLREVVLLLEANFIDAGLATETEQRVAWRCLLEASLRANSASSIAELFEDTLRMKINNLGVTQRLNEADLVFREMVPNLEQQLEWRMRPLREQWEAYGPGMLAHVRRIVPNCTSERGMDAKVHLLHPISGGFGASHPPLAAVRIEAVLTNPLPQLPEVVRLGWLLTHLHVLSWRHDASIEEENLLPLGALALLPAALDASQVVELSRIDESLLALAIEQWQIATPCDAGQTAAILLHWWEDFLQTRSEWPIALQTLQRSLRAAIAKDRSRRSPV